MTLAIVLKYLTQYYRQIAIGLGLLILIVTLAVSFRSCKSATEKRIEERQPVIVETQQGANQAINAAVNANTAAQDAQNQVNRVRRDKQMNVSVDEANRNRCAAFPESCK
jgi:hypothetical protein